MGVRAAQALAKTWPACQTRGARAIVVRLQRSARVCIAAEMRPTREWQEPIAVSGNGAISGARSLRFDYSDQMSRVNRSCAPRASSARVRTAQVRVISLFVLAESENAREKARVVKPEMEGRARGVVVGLESI